MNSTVLDLAAWLVKTSERAAARLNKTATFLAGLSHEERLDWLILTSNKK